LDLEEIELLNLLTTMFLDFADLRARDRQAITMDEWTRQTDEFLTFNRQAVLKNAGRVSHEQMEKIIGERYALFEKKRQAAEKIEAEREHEEEIQHLTEAAQKILKIRKRPENSKRKKLSE
jgi:hypothetical protein